MSRLRWTFTRSCFEQLRLTTDARVGCGGRWEALRFSRAETAAPGVDRAGGASTSTRGGDHHEKAAARRCAARWVRDDGGSGASRDEVAPRHGADAGRNQQGRPADGQRADL